ncbi:terminase [Staphylococcus haemolyticus]|uniref:terminase n=1 Tax=Staphylococcus haemolyticus TaxID=1283 RepID=UPI0039BD83E2
MPVSVKKIRESMLSKVDDSDFLVVEKIERYIALVKKYRQLITAINKDGITINVTNSSQRYIKTHPSMTDVIKINKELLLLEKAIFKRSKVKKDESKTTTKPLSLRDRIASSK